MKTKTKSKNIGSLLLEHEKLLEQMIDLHGLQAGEVLALTYAWINIHRPECVELYEDGTSPVYFYGPRDL